MTQPDFTQASSPNQRDGQPRRLATLSAVRRVGRIAAHLEPDSFTSPISNAKSRSSSVSTAASNSIADSSFVETDNVQNLMPHTHTEQKAQKAHKDKENGESTSSYTSWRRKSRDFLRRASLQSVNPNIFGPTSKTKSQGYASVAVRDPDRQIIRSENYRHGPIATAYPLPTPPVQAQARQDSENSRQTDSEAQPARQGPEKTSHAATTNPGSPVTLDAVTGELARMDRPSESAMRIFCSMYEQNRNIDSSSSNNPVPFTTEISTEVPYYRPTHDSDAQQQLSQAVERTERAIAGLETALEESARTNAITDHESAELQGFAGIARASWRAQYERWQENVQNSKTVDDLERESTTSFVYNDASANPDAVSWVRTPDAAVAFDIDNEPSVADSLGLNPKFVDIDSDPPANSVSWVSTPRTPDVPYDIDNQSSSNSVSSPHKSDEATYQSTTFAQTTSTSFLQLKNAQIPLQLPTNNRNSNDARYADIDLQMKAVSFFRREIEEARRMLKKKYPKEILISI